MTLQEMLSRPEVKAMYKELVKKYHPDVGGDQETMKKVNAAKDEGDDEMIDLYNQLVMGKKKEKKSRGPTIKPGPKAEKKEEESKYSDVGLDEIKSDLHKYSDWARNIEERLNKIIRHQYIFLIVRAHQYSAGKWRLDLDITIKGVPSGKVVKRAYIYNIQRFSSESQMYEHIMNEIK